MKWLCNIKPEEYSDVYDLLVFLSHKANTLIGGYLIGIPKEQNKAAPELLKKGFIGIYV